VYQPSRIEVVADKAITLKIVREDVTPYSEFLIFDTLKIHEKLPLKKQHIINLGLLTRGTYSFGCQMKMYVGELIVN
jgi:plastocyanin domain-containing protein